MPENTVRFFPPISNQSSRFWYYKEKATKTTTIFTGIRSAGAEINPERNWELPALCGNQWKLLWGEANYVRSASSSPSGSVQMFWLENLLNLFNQLGPATFNHANGSRLQCSSRLASESLARLSVERRIGISAGTTKFLTVMGLKMQLSKQMLLPS